MPLYATRCTGPGGVFSWCENSSGGTFAPILDAHQLHGGSCESVALSEPWEFAPEGPADPLLCASFRSKLVPDGQPPAAHLLYRLAAGGDCSSSGSGGAGGDAWQQAGAAAGRGDALRGMIRLTGHASCKVVTSGDFMRVPAAGDGAVGLAFFSGDEARNTVAAWDCSGGGRLGAWPRAVAGLPGPVVQCAAVTRGAGSAPLMGVLCESKLALCSWERGDVAGACW